MLQNLVCKQLDVKEEDFEKAISSFTGAAKRLEIVSINDNTNVYKDFAHSPSKLKTTIEAVKAQFPDRKLVACIELHTFSSLNKNFLSQYDGSMLLADVAIVFIDKKTFVHKKMEPFTSTDVQLAFKDQRIMFFDDVALLESYLTDMNYHNTNLLMMSSGNYSGLDLVNLARELNTFV